MFHVKHAQGVLCEVCPADEVEAGQCDGRQIMALGMPVCLTFK